MEVQTEVANETNGIPETVGFNETNGVKEMNGVHYVNGYVGGAEMKCESSTGIDVLIVGAGLGGMFAAVELYRQGHQVRIIEAKEKMEGLGKPFGC